MWGVWLLFTLGIVLEHQHVLFEYLGIGSSLLLAGLHVLNFRSRARCAAPYAAGMTIGVFRTPRYHNSPGPPFHSAAFPCSDAVMAKGSQVVPFPTPGSHLLLDHQ